MNTLTGLGDLISKYRYVDSKLNDDEMTIYRALQFILSENSRFIYSPVSLVRIKSYLVKIGHKFGLRGREYTIRKIRYCLDCLIKKNYISRKVFIYKSKKGGIRKIGYYRFEYYL
jgi:hypothetical protein